VLEVNPRASRTVPYVSKTTNVPLAKVAARLMTGRKLREMKLPIVEHGGVAEIAPSGFYTVKSPVFPFNKFRGVDTILGPEMRSTGEVMGIAADFGRAFAKAQLAAAPAAGLPSRGTVFLSVCDRDKEEVIPLARDLAALGFTLVATRGTAAALKFHGIEAAPVYKVNEGQPNIVDLIKSDKVDLIVNTPLGRDSQYDEKSIRRAAIRYNVPCITTLAAARAAVQGIQSVKQERCEVASLQKLHRKAAQSATAQVTSTGD
jgi:carbamoyl-phosphate synthase large subunit